MTNVAVATALLALVGAALVPSLAAQGPGACIAVSCVEVTKVDPADINNNVQTCAGNMAIQVGVENTANFCSGNQTAGSAFR